MLPGLAEANYVQAQIRKAGIQDIQLFWDKQCEMWVVCQVQKYGGILLPDNYNQDDIKPYILWYIKDNDKGTFRFPNHNDIMDAIITAQKAHKIWDKGPDYLADKLDEQSAEKDRKHRENFHQKIKDIAPAMKKAIRKEL